MGRSSQTVGLSNAPAARQWLACAAPVAVAVPLSILFVDRPVAEWVRANLPDARPFFDDLTHLVDPFHGFASLMLIWAVLRFASGATLSAAENAPLRLAAAIACASLVKDQLKWAFGRTWPNTWVHNNPSFFRDGVYGFLPFHGGEGWASFPSGHTTIICASAAVLWIAWPRLRALYGLLVLAVAVGLIATNYHWLGDVIAGAALGTAVGVVAATIGTRVDRRERQTIL